MRNHALALALSCLPAAAQTVELSPPGDGLVGDDLAVRVTGLPPDVEVVLFSELVDRYGRLWLSESTFRSDDGGVVDPGREAPVAAAWSDVDPLGPFWSPTRRTKEDAHERPGAGNAERLALTAIVDGRPLATAATTRWWRRPEVEQLELGAEGVVARMFVGPGDAPKPGVVVVPGSGGGLPTATAELLASHGYATLALAYFGEPGLPPDLERVPLEYVESALDAFMEHPRVDRARVALLGGSKGGELTLVMGSRRPDLAALVAIVPSSVVWQSISDRWASTSSWTAADEELPFVPYVVPQSFRETGRLSLLYDASLEDLAAVERATIPIENAACPILLISGREDWVWPSALMSTAVAVRLEAFGYAHEVRNLVYEDVGHQVFAPGSRPASWNPRVGGTRQGHGAAQAEGWAETLAFLAGVLGRDGR